MKTEIMKVDPQEYGLKKEQAIGIEEAFMPKIIERDALKNVYEELLTKELSPEVCKGARELRLLLVKVRTGIADIHRTQKAFYLAAGRYVDAWKNKETLPVEQMEEVLLGMEKYYENIEIERKKKLRSERLSELSKYNIDGSFIAAEEMSDEVWSTYLEGARLQYENKIALERKAEEERVRKEAINQLHEERKYSVLHLWNFLPGGILDVNFGEIDKEEWEKIVAAAEADKKAKEVEEERIRKQNEKLAREKKAAEEKLRLEREAAEEKLRKEKAAAQEKLRKANEEAKAKLAKERLAREEAEKAIRDQKEKERMQKEAAEKAAKKAAAAPDKDKLILFAKELRGLSIPKTSTNEAAEIAYNFKNMLEKALIYLEERASQL